MGARLGLSRGVPTGGTGALSPDVLRSEAHSAAWDVGPVMAAAVMGQQRQRGESDEVLGRSPRLREAWGRGARKWGGTALRRTSHGASGGFVNKATAPGTEGQGLGEERLDLRAPGRASGCRAGEPPGGATKGTGAVRGSWPCLRPDGEGSTGVWMWTSKAGLTRRYALNPRSSSSANHTRRKLIKFFK